jgi:hypothetical protein
MSRPPASLETLFARCIPPVCREEVLGDLCEKYTSPVQYFFLAARTIPFVILSRLRRINGPAFLLTDPLPIYGGFLLEAWYRGALSRNDPAAFLRLAMPAALTWLYLAARDAFAPAPGKPPAFEPAGLIVMFVFMATAGSPTWFYGFGSAWILVSSTRLLLPSDPDPRWAWLANSRTSRKVFAGFVASWVLLHFPGPGIWTGAGLWVSTLAYYRLKRRAAK